MSNTRNIMVTSCKGGVGKSTVAANLGIRLAYNGYKTLILDCDFGVRSLDLIMGLEDDIIYDISDIITHDIQPEKAIVSDPRCEKLFFCAAPYNYNDDISPEVFKEKIGLIGESMEFDFIIIDTPGDVGKPFRLAASVADLALVVSTYQPASIRAAERTGMLLSELGVSSRRLIVNCFDAYNLDLEVQPDMLEIIDKTCIQLIGIIPLDFELQFLQSQGKDVFEAKNSDASAAFANIADRLIGKNVPLFTGFKSFKRTKLMKRIQK